ncbi:DciA family protein [Embleya sp. NBC_00896]|uniref:DciA family protein n=1 Tax=Embleya sp. NBC_00896 TaxID=2975961 RepID=UPI002F9114B4|nr:DUF721 domain-containing protein [Embleya sp. NBC_00896]
MTDTYPTQPADQHVRANNSAAGGGGTPRDLARQTLRETLAALRRASGDSQVTSKATTRRPLGSAGADGRDPRPVSAVLEDLMVTHAWEAPTAAAAIVDAWAQIAPELAAHVTIEHYDPGTRRLELRPDSPTYATQLRLLGDAAICRRVNAVVGHDVVRAVRVLTIGSPRVRPPTRLPECPPTRKPPPPGPRNRPIPRPDSDHPQPVGPGRPDNPWARAAARARRERVGESPRATRNTDTEPRQ